MKKLRLILGSISLLVLILLPLYKNNFYKDVKITPWKQLTWDDFKGTVRPFTYWSAGIYSDIYVGYDSTTQRHYVYAGQNNQLSWKKKSSINSNSLLRHEQYHFNITEAHARMLNSVLVEKGITKLNEVLQLKNSTFLTVKKMQDKYDSESEHGINRTMQHSWEFRIDSLLLAYSEEPKFTNNYYSGASVFFPKKPQFEKGLLYHSHSLHQYGMNLTMKSYQFESIDVDFFSQSLKSHYVNSSLKMLDFKMDSLFNEPHFTFLLQNLENNKIIHHDWVLKQQYAHNITASYSAFSQEDSTNYSLIAKSFLNSFKLIDTKAHWLQMASELKDEETSFSEAQNYRKESFNPENEQCLVFSKESIKMFGLDFVVNDLGDLIIPFSNVNIHDSLVYEYIVYLNGSIVSFSPENDNRPMVIPHGQLPKNEFSLYLGYTLKSDTSQQCFQFYNQKITLPDL